MIFHVRNDVRRIIRMSFLLGIIPLLANANFTQTQSHFTEEAADAERKAQTLNETGEFLLEFGVNIGEQDTVLDTPFLKAGLEQSIKDYLNLQLKCGSARKMNGHSSFHSLSIEKTVSTAKKRAVISGIGRCNGNLNKCNLGVESAVIKKSGKRFNPNISKKDQNSCQDLNSATLFDMFDKILVSGLFFSYNADIHEKRSELQESLDLDYNIILMSLKKLNSP